MSQAELLQQLIAEKAGKAASISIDGHSTSQRNLTELIAAAQYLNAQQGAALPHRGLRLTKIIPPGGGG